MSTEAKETEMANILDQLEDLDPAFIQEWEDLKRQLRELKEEQERPVLVPVLKETE